VYTSIDRVDIVAEKDGVKLFLQTDHRSAEEMDEDPELSVLFALIRTLLPRRLAAAEPGPSRVRYVAMQAVSRAVHEAVASTGAELEMPASGHREPVAFDGPVSAPAELADQAFAGLARRVLLREELPLSAEGLAAFEGRVLQTEWDLEDEEQEIERWTAALELAALVGECLRQQTGGRWVITADELGSRDASITADDFGLLPFAFRFGDQQLSNAANKAIRAMTEPGQSTVQLLSAMAESGEGVTMLTLKPASWGTHGMIALELIGGVDQGPNAVVCEDHPNTVAYTMIGDQSPEQQAAKVTEALANLAKIEVEIEPIDIDGEMDLLLVQGSYYAAEKILDEAFMHSLHARLRQELLAVAVPNKGRMFVTAGVQSPENLLRLVSIAENAFENEANPITPLVFGVMNGKVSAVIRPEPPKKKGFWGKLFH
jgi:hypothetical protein